MLLRAALAVRAEAYVAVFIPINPANPEKKPPVKKANHTHSFCNPFRSGAVMGLVVVGLALLDISLWWLVLDYFVEEASVAGIIFGNTGFYLTYQIGTDISGFRKNSASHTGKQSLGRSTRHDEGIRRNGYDETYCRPCA